MAMSIGGSDVETVLFPAIVAAGGGVINVPVGVSTGFFTMGASNVTFQGAGMQASVLQFAAGAPTTMISANSATFRNNVRFADLCLDGANSANLIALVAGGGYGTDSWVFERVWFKNFTGALGVSLAQLTNSRFTDCRFTNPGNCSGTSVILTEGCFDVTFEGNTFEWVNSALIAASGAAGELVSQRLRFTSNFVRQDYWNILAYNSPDAIGSGGTVSYTFGDGTTFSGTLVDTSKDFTTIPADSFRTIRVMPVLRTGTTSNFINTVFEDAGAAFLTYGVQFGDIIRTATAWTMVIATVATDTTKLVIDGWRSLTTYEQVGSPTIGTAYTLYRVYLGEMFSRTATTIVTPRWRDMLGNSVLPAAGTRYEILGERAAAGIHCHAGVQGAIIADNFFQGSWADQITSRGPRCLIEDNICMWGQDMGITVQGDGSIVQGGTLAYNGANGLFSSDTDGLIISNVTFLDNGTEYVVSPTGGDMQIMNCSDVLIQGCTVQKAGIPNSYRALWLRGVCTNIRYFDNVNRGHHTQVVADAALSQFQARVLYPNTLPAVVQYPTGPLQL